MILAHSSGWAVAVLAGVVPASLYLYGVTAVERRTRTPWSRRRTTSFLTGCALLAAALTPAVDHVARADLAGHMAQHLLVAMFAPIALVLGAPMTLLLGAVGLPERRGIRRLTSSRPLRIAIDLRVATMLVIGGVYVLYLTPLYALTTTSVVVHHLVHLHFVVAGYLFAWAVAGPDPAPGRPGIGWRVSALVVAGGSHAFLAKVLYARAPTWPSGAGVTIAEIETAAQWMYYGGHLADLALATALFAAWYRRRPRVRAAAVERRSGAGPLAAEGVLPVSPVNGPSPRREDRSA